LMNPTPLYSEESEKAVLGCLIAHASIVADEVCGALQVEDFLVPAHQRIFEAIRDLYLESRVPIELMTVHQRLSDRGLAAKLGSPGILAELGNAFASELNIQGYVEIVKKKTLLRTLFYAMEEVAKDILENPEAPEDVLARAQKGLDRLSSTRQASRLLSASACVSAFQQQLEGIQRGDIQNRLKTGLRAIDEGNGGLPMPGYVIIAGEQGVGKSAIVLNIMKHCCENGIPVAGFSMEMTVEQIIQREVANLARMDGRLMNRPLNPQDEADVREALEKVRQWPFWIDPSSGLTPNELKSRARKMAQQGAKVIWIDNAQLTEGSSRQDKRNEQLMEVSRTVQYIQKEFNVTVILVAQVTRDGQKRGHLKAFDIADCAAFERDARMILMLEPAPQEQGKPVNKFAMPIIGRLVKYNEGVIGDVEFIFNAQEQRIQ
jgi:replicative DNA helicase